MDQRLTTYAINQSLRWFLCFAACCLNTGDCYGRQAGLPPLGEPALGCLWDYDTIWVERNTFPSVNELIAGQFIRHSDAYYQWRLEDRNAIPTSDWTPETFDDVAVAHDKLKQSDKAIDVILAKQQRFPDKGQYETAANLGTFLIHAGRYEEGLEHIKAAIDINPDAHFGRERYQQLLVEFLLTLKQEDPEVSPVSEQFDEFVLESQGKSKDHRSDEQQAEIDRAIEGVTGMIRFGNSDSPILLSALGDLLNYGEAKDAKRLAARAYLKAAWESSDPEHIRILRDKAKWAVDLQVAVSLKSVEEKLRKEVEQGQAFFAQIADDEQRWIAEEQDVDERFKKAYYMEPKMVRNPFKSPKNIFLFLSFLAIVAFIVSKRKQKRKSSDQGLTIQ